MLTGSQDTRRPSDGLGHRPAAHSAECGIDPLDFSGSVGDDHAVRRCFESRLLEAVRGDLALQRVVRCGQLGRPLRDEPLDTRGTCRQKKICHDRGRHQEPAPQDAPTLLATGVGREICLARIEKKLPLALAHDDRGAEMHSSAYGRGVLDPRSVRTRAGVVEV